MSNGKFVDKFSFVAAYITLYMLYLFPLIIILILVIYKYKHGKLDNKLKYNFGAIILLIKTNSV